jgi:hypothetical protein
MHWKASFTFQAVLQWFEFECLTPKRCLQFDYTAFGFNCQLRSCHILVGFLLISPVKPTITSKTKKDLFTDADQFVQPGAQVL